MEEMKEEEERKWFDELIPKLVKSLDDSREFRNVTYDFSRPSEAFYLSKMYKLDLTFHGDPRNGQRRETISLILKAPNEDESMKEAMKADCQFHNEILFYEEFAAGSTDYPRCFYTVEDPPNFLLALENVTTRGFDVHSQRFNVSIDYTLAAMRELAKFHAKAYVMKERRTSEFSDIVKQIQETRYDENNMDVEILVNVTSQRSVDYLRSEGYDGAFCDRVARYFDNAFENIMKKSTEPDEPLATLCHGDYTLNNILFKKENGELQAMPIDFALIRYATPAVDLSTYFYLCCPMEDIRNNFDKMFGTYHGTLKNSLEEAGLENLERFSYDALLEDYKKKALFGYTIACFFLPILMGKNEKPPAEMMMLGMKEAAKMLSKVGGDEMSRLFADMLLELKDRGWLDHIP